MFRCRLWTRCLFTFTKLPTLQNRYGVSSLDKASTTRRSELIPKQVKPCTASSPAVTVSSSAEDQPGLQSAPAGGIRTDCAVELKYRLLALCLLSPASPENR